PVRAASTAAQAWLPGAEGSRAMRGNGPFASGGDGSSSDQTPADRPGSATAEASPRITFATSQRQLDERTRVLGVEGELDLASAPNLKWALADALSGATNQLVVDLSSVRFIDSTGLHVSAATAKRGNSRPLSLPSVPRVAPAVLPLQLESGSKGESGSAVPLPQAPVVTVKPRRELPGARGRGSGRLSAPASNQAAGRKQALILAGVRKGAEGAAAAQPAEGAPVAATAPAATRLRK